MLRTWFARYRFVQFGARTLPLAFVVACEPPPTNTPTYWNGTGPSLDATPALRDARSTPAREDAGGPPLPSPKLDAQPAVTMDAREPDAARTADAAPSLPDADNTPITPGAKVSANCSVQVTATTTPSNGDYEPRNVGVIWIADARGQFVKTLEVWAARRLRYLSVWDDATAAANLPRNTVDAITAATAGSHRTHMPRWNCTDAKKAPVTQGRYRLYLEMTESNADGPTRFVEFTLGPQPATMNAPDSEGWKGVKLVITP